MERLTALIAAAFAIVLALVFLAIGVPVLLEASRGESFVPAQPGDTEPQPIPSDSLITVIDGDTIRVDGERLRI